MTSEEELVQKIEHQLTNPLAKSLLALARLNAQGARARYNMGNVDGNTAMGVAFSNAIAAAVLTQAITQIDNIDVAVSTGSKGLVVDVAER